MSCQKPANPFQKAAISVGFAVARDRITYAYVNPVHSTNIGIIVEAVATGDGNIFLFVPTVENYITT